MITNATNTDWIYIVVLIIFILILAYKMFLFIRLPREKQIENVKQWLMFAVIGAEKIYGSKTGELKLRSVYDRAIEKFPWIASAITFEQFSEWVDESLDKIKDGIIDSNILPDSSMED